MKSRGIFAIVAATLAIIGRAFHTHASPIVSDRVSNGRQAFYNVSGPHRANQRKHYAKGWS